MILHVFYCTTYYTGNPVDTAALVDDLLQTSNNPTYPTRFDHDKRLECQRMADKLFSVQDFLDMFDDPIAHFYDQTKATTFVTYQKNILFIIFFFFFFLILSSFYISILTRSIDCKQSMNCAPNSGTFRPAIFRTHFASTTIITRRAGGTCSPPRPEVSTRGGHRRVKVHATSGTCSTRTPCSF